MKPGDRRLDRTRPASLDLRAAWERNASAFVAWARRPGHDSYWRFHRDVFLELVPTPRGRTLDLGCGEGRLARDLKSRGHDVVGIDASPTMISAARAADPDLELHVGDAAALPFPDGAFGCVVAFMSLQDADDAAGAIAETARVLAPGGHVCAAIVHPLNSAGRFTGDAEASPFVIDGSYLDVSYYVDQVARDGLEMVFASVHRPLQAYTDAIWDAGLLIERLREPGMPTHAVAAAHDRRWLRLPLFLHVRALKPA